MKKICTFLLAALTGSAAMAQYCSPSFVNGCSLWRNLSISIGTINWTIGSTACTVSDYTSVSTIVTPGVPEPMTVMSGNWTGCSVWIDLNSNQAFEDAENMFHTYVGGDPSYTYSFDVTVPAGTPAGSYRMRVIAPWGSDGYTPGSLNGFGPCGAYQYGNFDDFTVEVAGSTGLAAPATMAHPSAVPNPTTGPVTLTSAGNGSIEQVVVSTMEGRMVKQFTPDANTGTATVDLSALPGGLYMLTTIGTAGTRMMRLIKE